MAQRFNYYVIVGDNGYGMSQDFSDIVQAAKQLRNEWHRGFQTEEEAYEYIKDQTFFRYALRSAGICDIDTLRAQKIILLSAGEIKAYGTGDEVMPLLMGNDAGNLQYECAKRGE